jgi:hypothetical protein
MTGFASFLFGVLAVAEPQPAPHWLGEIRILAKPGETISSEEGPDFTVRTVLQDGKPLFSAYHGNYPSVDHYRRQRFARACDAEYFRLWSRDRGPKRVVGYLVRRETFATHLFGDAVTGTRKALRAFERRIVIPRC